MFKFLLSASYVELRNEAVFGCLWLVTLGRSTPGVFSVDLEGLIYGWAPGLFFNGELKSFVVGIRILNSTHL